MKEIIYTKGDATSPRLEGNKIIAHICNDIGGWGRGFVLAISRRWKEPEREYRKWFHDRDKSDFGLGAIQIVQVEDEIWVANMIGQHEIKKSSSGKAVPIRYEAVDECLRKLSLKSRNLNASVHMPRIGCGLAGGKWEEIELLIIKNLAKQDVEVFVYDFD